jgi:hypothetical protein
MARTIQSAVQVSAPTKVGLNVGLKDLEFHTTKSATVNIQIYTVAVYIKLYRKQIIICETTQAALELDNESSSSLITSTTLSVDGRSPGASDQHSSMKCQ